ncbi:lipoprotein [Methylococcus sp. EFPC2]|uniref:LPS translocon maturation chaperone LptM n=1 Tax=Methylococcus sp. EFPC2 TaxID=2812648 RepID=UPI001968243B|nr:lipoprotein [Methylococcus sp. EFPC2]QSA97239.1 lipoprotein [Methylococcus sp. EFPC2]
MNSYTRAVLLTAILTLLSACGQKGPLYVEREEAPVSSTDQAQAPQKPVKTTVEPASKDNTSTELPPVIQ